MGKLTSADCLKCGICCTSLTWEETYVNLTPKDEERLGKRYVKLHVINGEIRTRPKINKSGPLQGVEDCRCASLRGSIIKKVRCSIYEKRPDVCRKALKPGDRQCIAVRQMFKDMCKREGIAADW